MSSAQALFACTTDHQVVSSANEWPAPHQLQCPETQRRDSANCLIARLFPRLFAPVNEVNGWWRFFLPPAPRCEGALENSERCAGEAPSSWMIFNSGESMDAGGGRRVNGIKSGR